MVGVSVLVQVRDGDGDGISWVISSIFDTLLLFSLHLVYSFLCSINPVSFYLWLVHTCIAVQSVGSKNNMMLYACTNIYEQLTNECTKKRRSQKTETPVDL